MIEEISVSFNEKEFKIRKRKPKMQTDSDSPKVSQNKQVSKVKLATIVEGDPKAPFSIATTPWCRGGRYSIPRIAPLYPWTVPYNAEC